MAKYIPIEKILQEVIPEKEIKKLAEKYGYKDTGRKLTVTVLFKYFLVSAIIKSVSFRELQFQGTKFNLPYVNYSTLSKKAADVPYQIFQELCNIILEKSSRSFRRKLTPIANSLFEAIDATCITAPKSKLPWSPFEKGRSGVKYHVKYDIDAGLPIEIKISPINVGDSEKLLDFKNDKNIFVCDRGYRSIEKMAILDNRNQKFVIRLKDKIVMNNIEPNTTNHNEKYEDVYCTLGQYKKISPEYREHKFRIIRFVGKNNKVVMLCTNLTEESAEEIAEIYRKRWSIEAFFKVLKQNFSIKKIFGTTENAVYSQGLIAFIAYVITFCSYNILIKKHKIDTTYINFLRMIRIDNLNVHLKSFCYSLLHL